MAGEHPDSAWVSVSRIVSVSCLWRLLYCDCVVFVLCLCFLVYDCVVYVLVSLRACVVFVCCVFCVCVGVCLEVLYAVVCLFMC